MKKAFMQTYKHNGIVDDKNRKIRNLRRVVAATEAMSRNT
jgi:hypothetical protein